MIESLKETLDTSLKDVIDAIDNAPVRDSFRSTENTFFGTSKKQSIKVSDAMSLVTAELMKARMDQIQHQNSFSIIERENIKKIAQAHITPALLLWYGWLVARESRHCIKALSKVAVLPPEFKDRYADSTESVESFFQTGELMDDGILRAVFIFSTRSHGKVFNTCQNMSIVTAVFVPQTGDTDEEKEGKKVKKVSSYTVELNHHDIQEIFGVGNIGIVKSLITEFAKERGIKVTFNEKLKWASVTMFKELYYLWVLRSIVVKSELVPPLTDANIMAYEELFLREIVADKLLPYDSPDIKMSFTDQIFLFVRENAAKPVLGRSGLINRSGAVVVQEEVNNITTEADAKRYVESKGPNTVHRTRFERYPSTRSIDITYGDLSTMLRGNIPNKNVVEWYLSMLKERSLYVTSRNSDTAATPRDVPSSVRDDRSQAKWQRIFVFNQDPSLRPSTKNARDINFGSYDVLLFPSILNPSDKKKKKLDSGNNENGALYWSFTAVKCNKDPKGEAKAIWFDLAKDDPNSYDKRRVNDAIDTYKKYYPNAKSQNVEIRRVIVNDRSFPPDYAIIVFLLYARTLFFGEPLVDFKYIEGTRIRMLREIVFQKIEETMFLRPMDLFSDMSVPCSSSSSKSRKQDHKDSHSLTPPPQPLPTTPLGQPEDDYKEFKMDDIDAQLNDIVESRESERPQHKKTPSKETPRKSKKKEHPKKTGTFDSIYNGTWVDKAMDEGNATEAGIAKGNDDDDDDDGMGSSVKWYESLVDNKMKRFCKLLSDHNGENLHTSQDLSLGYADLESVLPKSVPSAAAVAWYMYLIQTKCLKKKGFVINSTHYDNWLINDSVERISSYAAHAKAFSDCEKVLFPVCIQGVHWCFVFTQASKMDHKHHKITFFLVDPFEAWDEKAMASIQKFLDKVVKGACGEIYNVSVEPLKMPNTEQSSMPSHLDSGPLILYFAKKFFSGIKPDFNGVDCDVLRLEIITELYMNELDLYSSS